MSARAAASVPGRRFARRLPVLLAALLPWAAPAQVHDAGDYLRRMDLDGDGRVAPDEYQRWMRYAFERMDRDGNGVLEPAEQPGGRGRPITREQHGQVILERFRRQDANGDGYLDARELMAPPR